MAVTGEALLSTNRLFERLAQHDANIFYRVVSIDFQITHCVDLQIKQAVPGNLGEHMFKEWQTGRQMTVALSIKVQVNLNLRFAGIASDACAAGRAHCQSPVLK